MKPPQGIQQASHYIQTYRTYLANLLVVTPFILSGCIEQPLDNNGPNQLNTSASLIALAGDDGEIQEREYVTLSGQTVGNDAISFSWQQISGPPVVMDDPETNEITFSAL